MSWRTGGGDGEEVHEREGPAHALALEVNVEDVAVGEDERFVVLVLQVVQHGVA